MPLLIRNGEIVTADSRYEADILRRRRDNHAHRQGSRSPARIPRSLTRQESCVFPGFIDPHVHIYLPFMSTFAKDTHETGKHRRA